MNEISQADLLKNAIEIGQEIIDKAIVDKNGIHWKTVKSVTKLDQLEKDANESIATGVSGIILFYIDLYKTTGSEIYLDYINNSANWLINYCETKPASHGFYSGSMGAAFVLIKISEITKKKYYRQNAILIGLKFKKISPASVKTFNLYDGLAGTILGLIYLHDELKEDWILDSVYDGIELLLTNVKSNGSGFYWDNHFGESRYLSTKPLCSLPLGSGGIGLLFYYLGQYLNNKHYNYIGIQALNYEDQYYDKALNCWPDFRINVNLKLTEKLRKSYLNGTRSLFESNNYSKNWMYGFAGHSFTRICAQDIIKAEYLNTNPNFIDTKLNLDNLNNQFSNYTLGSGKCGFGLLLLTLSQLRENENFYENALAIAQMAIDDRSANKFYQFGFDNQIEYEDDSFLMGNAGIGYFYLKLLNKERDTILFPSLNRSSTKDSEHKVYHFNINYAVDKICRSWYPNTFEASIPESKLEISNLNLESLKNSLTAKIEQVVQHSQDLRINDAYNYDKVKLNVQNAIDNNYGYFQICHTTEVSRNKGFLENYTRSKLFSKTLQLNQYSHFCINKWDWKNSIPNDVQQSTRQIITLHSLGEEYILSETQYAILNCFTTPHKVNSIYKLFIDTNQSSNIDHEYLLHSFSDVIRYFISKGVLITPKHSVLQYPGLKTKELKKSLVKDFSYNVLN